MSADDFIKLEHGPYGTRWAYTYDPEADSPPTLEEAEKVLGVKLARSIDSGERTDDLAEEVYFPEDYDANTLDTYRVQ
jgi:hypothetical protein